MLLKILGRLTTNLLSISKKAWHIASLEQSEVILFCDYSGFEIPIGSTFYKLMDLNNRNVYLGEIVLTNVTQQFMKPFESIPKGWKTICMFKFAEDSVPQAIKNLPEIETWFGSSSFLILSQ